MALGTPNPNQINNQLNTPFVPTGPLMTPGMQNVANAVKAGVDSTVDAMRDLPTIVTAIDGVLSTIAGPNLANWNRQELNTAFLREEFQSRTSWSLDMYDMLALDERNISYECLSLQGRFALSYLGYHLAHGTLRDPSGTTNEEAFRLHLQSEVMRIDSVAKANVSALRNAAGNPASIYDSVIHDVDPDPSLSVVTIGHNTPTAFQTLTEAAVKKLESGSFPDYDDLYVQTLEEMMADSSIENSVKQRAHNDLGIPLNISTSQLRTELQSRASGSIPNLSQHTKDKKDLETSKSLFLSICKKPLEEVEKAEDLQKKFEATLQDMRKINPRAYTGLHINTTMISPYYKGQISVQKNVQKALDAVNLYETIEDLDVEIGKYGAPPATGGAPSPVPGTIDYLQQEIAKSTVDAKMRAQYANQLQDLTNKLRAAEVKKAQAENKIIAIFNSGILPATASNSKADFEAFVSAHQDKNHSEMLKKEDDLIRYMEEYNLLTGGQSLDDFKDDKTTEVNTHYARRAPYALSFLTFDGVKNEEARLTSAIDAVDQLLQPPYSSTEQTLAKELLEKLNKTNDISPEKQKLKDKFQELMRAYQGTMNERMNSYLHILPTTGKHFEHNKLMQEEQEILEAAEFIIDELGLNVEEFYAKLNEQKEHDEAVALYEVVHRAMEGFRVNYHVTPPVHTGTPEEIANATNARIQFIDKHKDRLQMVFDNYPPRTEGHAKAKMWFIHNFSTEGAELRRILGESMSDRALNDAAEVHFKLSQHQRSMLYGSSRLYETRKPKGLAGLFINNRREVEDAIEKIGEWDGWKALGKHGFGTLGVLTGYTAKGVSAITGGLLKHGAHHLIRRPSEGISNFITRNRLWPLYVAWPLFKTLSYTGQGASWLGEQSNKKIRDQWLSRENIGNFYESSKEFGEKFGEKSAKGTAKVTEIGTRYALERADYRYRTQFKGAKDAFRKIHKNVLISHAAGYGRTQNLARRNFAIDKKNYDKKKTYEMTREILGDNVMSAKMAYHVAKNLSDSSDSKAA